jgi:hypothetical protein
MDGASMSVTEPSGEQTYNFPELLSKLNQTARERDKAIVERNQVERIAGRYREDLDRFARLHDAAMSSDCTCAVCTELREGDES